MRIHCLQHTEYPGPSHFPTWAARHGHAWACTLVPPSGALPHAADVDCLVVLGGPMSAWEDQLHPWLVAEKRFIEAFFRSGKPVLGICLGAQILADVLGARTYPGPHKEIGWFAVEATPEGRETWLGAALPERFEAFLWHGDTFDLPEGAVRVARSAAFENQGFVWRQTLALQFHLEVHPEWVRMLARRDAAQLVEATYIQSADAILGKPAGLYQANNALMDSLLGRWLSHRRSPPDR